MVPPRPMTASKSNGIFLFYKTITLFSHAETAAVLQGTLAPVVLSSRGDTIKSKFYSLANARL